MIVVSDFSSADVVSGAESPREIRNEHKPIFPKDEECHVTMRISPGRRWDAKMILDLTLTMISRTNIIEGDANFMTSTSKWN